MLAALANAGANLGEVVPSLGVSPDALVDPEARLPTELFFKLCEEATPLTGDPDFGLHAGERVPHGALEVLEYATRASPNIHEALLRVARYYALLSTNFTVAIEVSGDSGRLWFQRPVVMAMPRHAVELPLALLVVRGRELTGKAWPMRRVGFTHERPANTSEHERIFGPRVVFGQPCDELVFDCSWLDEPLLTADPALSSVLERYAETLVAKLPAQGSFIADARSAVAKALSGRDPSLQATAERLHMSTRTLRRKLQAEGTSHQGVVESVRRDLAGRYLLDESLGIGEIAYLLGFSEASAFHRAFKRWTGETPAEFRSARRG